MGSCFRSSSALAAGFAAFALMVWPPTSALAGDRVPPPALEITPQLTFTTDSDARRTPGGPPVTSGTLRLNERLIVPITRRLAFTYGHGNINETLGAAPPPQDVLVNDLTDDFALHYAVSKAMTLSTGYFYRHRVCCPAAADPNNAQPLTVHSAYVDTSYQFRPMPTLAGSTFSISARATKALAHKVTPASVRAATGLADEGDKWTASASGQLEIPVDPRRGTTTYVAYTWANDYFDYQPIAFWYNIVDFGLTKRLNKMATFNANISNLTQHRQGYPFSGFNAIHRAKIVLSTTYRVGP